MPDRAPLTSFEGSWCGTCRTAYPYTPVPADIHCPWCVTAKVRKATITVEVHDLGE